MNFSEACERVGGRLTSPNTCVLGRNVVQKIDEFHYNIITPVTIIRVRSASTKPRGRGLLFLFNNCGVEVMPEHVEMKCFTPGKDNDLNIYIEEVFSAVI